MLVFSLVPLRDQFILSAKLWSSQKPTFDDWYHTTRLHCIILAGDIGKRFHETFIVSLSSLLQSEVEKLNAALRERITQYMEKCNSCTIATVSADGQPSASTVFFKNRGMNIFFNTGRDSQKVRNILENPRVSIAMQAGPPPTKDRDIKGIQYFGKGRIVSSPNASEVPKAVMARHKVFNSATAGNSVIVEVTPDKVYLIDYSLGFRHRDLIGF